MQIRPFPYCIHTSYQAIPVSAEDSKDTRPVKKPSGPPLSFFLVFTKTEAFAKTVEWEQKHQLWGGLIYVLVYAVCIMFCCPSTVFDLTAGYLFGFGFGSLVAVGGKTLGSVVSFLIGRYFMKDTVRRKLQEGQPMFRAWALLLERDALQFVVLVQLASMPIFLKNYGLAILHIPFGLFLWTTILSAARKQSSRKAAATDSKSQLVQEILLIVTVVATLLLAIVGGYKTRKYIDELAMKELEKEELLHPSA
ncbi:hypothetical protein AC1031_007009 [Aphanomyces cochlioides]|nr:hypothetical protein AC1031_007009 [Aphanomyces cochlioides]